MRTSPDGGRNYPGSHVRMLTAALPSQPAAVPTYDKHGLTRCFNADFDVSHGGPARTAADASGFEQLVAACGGRVVVDTSPNGGRHVYLPLAERVTFDEARAVALALRRRFASYDPGPMLSVRTGCIRPPGAWHKSCGGAAHGHQRLLTPFRHAVSVFSSPNPPPVWQRLVAALHAELRANEPARALPDAFPAVGDALELAAHRAVVPRVRRAPLSGPLAETAATGLYDATRYATASDARQAVIAALAVRGWSFADVVTAYEQGHWPGLAALYRHAHAPRRLLPREWLKAITYVTRNDLTSRVHNSPTRASTTRRGEDNQLRSVTTPDHSDVYGWIRTWWAAVQLAERTGRWPGRGALRKRIALRALGWAAQCTGELEQEFGTRAHGLATQRDATTMAAAHRELAAEDDPFLIKVCDAHGTHAHRYRLRIPDAYFDAAVRTTWRPGRIEALHPAFRVLGDVAGLVYEALDRTPATRFDVAEHACVSPRAAHDALHVLAAAGLAHHASHGGWTRGLAHPDTVADTNGGRAEHDVVVRRYCLERHAWHTYLGVVATTEASQSLVPAAPQPVSAQHPCTAYDEPDEPAETPLQLLERILGAVVSSEAPTHRPRKYKPTDHQANRLPNRQSNRAVAQQSPGAPNQQSPAPPTDLTPAHRRVGTAGVLIFRTVKAPDFQHNPGRTEPPN